MIADRASVRAPSPTCDEHHCITCGDDGDPMTVVRVDSDRGLALCADEDGGRHTVETALVEPVSPGDQILVHAGTAIAALSGAQDSPAQARMSADALNESEAPAR
ncbi:MAG: HypC/HybG/HupF family hydrogenase formation chaperone [Actinomycetota bacterium]|nr:HypC/HybG/HupF family hydrogenase formation chaperone [Actinomycetota bacterium]